MGLARSLSLSVVSRSEIGVLVPSAVGIGSARLSDWVPFWPNKIEQDSRAATMVYRTGAISENYQRITTSCVPFEVSICVPREVSICGPFRVAAFRELSMEPSLGILLDIQEKGPGTIVFLNHLLTAPILIAFIS